MAKITKDTLIVDCLKINPNSAEILQAVGMHCLGCAMSHGVTIEQAVIGNNGGCCQLRLNLPLTTESQNFIIWI